LTIVVASSHKGAGQSRAESDEPVGVTSGSEREGSSPGHRGRSHARLPLAVSPQDVGAGGAKPLPRLVKRGDGQRHRSYAPLVIAKGRSVAGIVDRTRYVTRTQSERPNEIEGVIVNVIATLAGDGC